MTNLVSKAASKSYAVLFDNLPSRTPIHLLYWRMARNLSRLITRKKNPLSPRIKKVKGLDLKNERLGKLVEYDDIGAWTIDEDTIDFFWDMLFEKKPQVIIECGSGVSTFLFALYASTIWGSMTPEPRIISIEQDAKEIVRINERLAENQLEGNVRMVFAPIDREGRYQLDVDEMLAALNGHLADLLLIDGPYGPEGCRVWTLPLLLQFCKNNACWYLDDALRDGEMYAIRDWSRTQNISVKGICPIGHGLACGQIIS